MTKPMNSSGRIEGIYYLDHSPVAVEFENGLIKKVERIKKLSGNGEPFFIAPGLIDIQINGYLSVSFALEGADNTSADGAGLTVADIRKVTEGLWKEGVTTYFPTLTTNRRELLLKNFAVLAGAMNDRSLLGSIAGFHLEGPYISPVDGYRGAHPKEHVRKPDWEEFVELNNAAGGKILIVTLAPEIEGAFGFIRKCREKGITVSLGHHNAPAKLIHEAIDNGAGLSTHLGNGCATMINRHHNPIWPQLADDRLMISIICDGFHLPPEMIKVFYKVKGADNIIITSDVTGYAGLPPGEYKIRTGETIVKTQDGNLLFSGMEGGLYGSASPLSKGVGHIMKVTGCSLANAIQMATINAARLNNLNNRGKLEPGKRADIILFSMNDFNMNIKKTIVAGKVVYQAD
jgi:N-acetylglucosamine-6-phosphate deacetylase